MLRFLQSLLWLQYGVKYFNLLLMYLLCPEIYVSVFRQMYLNHNTDFRNCNI